MIDVGRDFERMRDYADGRLSEEERRGFEDRLLRDPELVRELEQSLRLREGLEELRAQGYLGTALLGSGTARTRASRAWLPALAAAALAGVAVLLWVQPTARLAPVLTAAPVAGGRADLAAPIAAEFTFVPMRGGAAPELTRPAQGLIELRAAPAGSASSYRIALVLEREGEPSRALGEVPDLGVSADGYLHSYVQASRLPPGRYALRVSPAGSGGTAGGSPETFRFTLRADASLP
jgi:hypothetical protein